MTIFEIFLICVILLLLFFLVVATTYLWNFARIILILQDDFSEATEVLQDTKELLEEILNMPMFFDSPEVQKVVSNALDSVKVSKVSFGKLIHKFTQRSKQKYIEVRERKKSEEDEEDE